MMSVLYYQHNPLNMAKHEWKQKVKCIAVVSDNMLYEQKTNWKTAQNVLFQKWKWFEQLMAGAMDSNTV